MRLWHGWIRSEDRDAYAAYLTQAGMPEYRAQPGNLDTRVLYRDVPDGETEVVIESRWESREAMQHFTGKEVDRALFYYRDRGLLLRGDPNVTIYDVHA